MKECSRTNCWLIKPLLIPKTSLSWSFKLPKASPQQISTLKRRNNHKITKEKKKPTEMKIKLINEKHIKKRFTSSNIKISCRTVYVNLLGLFA